MRTDELDEQGRQERAEADREGAETLQDAEHPGQHVVGEPSGR